MSLPAEGQFLVGRSTDADRPVLDPTVSRRHASSIRKGETWLLTDLTSRHGTAVNDRKLEPGSPTPIEDGEVIAVGSWRCRCTSGTNRSGVRTPFAPLPAQAASVSAIPAQQVGGVAQRGFDVLMLMAACQSQLRTHLLSPVTLATAMASVNADLHQRTETSKFVTLIAGILDTDRRAEELVDAGHGLCVYAPDESQPRRIETTPGFLLGVVETADREIHELRLQPGSSLVLFSDGAVEQTNPDGDQHGIEGVLTSSTGASGREPVVKRPLESVR